MGVGGWRKLADGGVVWKGRRGRGQEFLKKYFFERDRSFRAQAAEFSRSALSLGDAMCAADGGQAGCVDGQASSD